MPPKKIVSIRTERSSAKKWKEKWRQNVSDEDNDKRRESNLIAKRKRRAEETETELNKRREFERIAQVQRREQETGDQRKNRIQLISSLSRLTKTRKNKKYLCIAYDNSDVEIYFIGEMNAICEFCGAKHFEAERPSDKKFKTCCHKGKVELIPLETYPTILEDLMTNRTNERHKTFNENIRTYNSSLAFASLGAKIRPPPGFGPYCFRIHGQIYHRISSAIPEGDDIPHYAQLYILDAEEACNIRLQMKENKHIDRELVEILDHLIRMHNPYAEAYKMLGEMLQEEENKSANNQVFMILRTDNNTNKKRYNVPTMNEVAVIFQNADGEPPLERDIRVYKKGEPFKTISILSEHVDPMTYPILFPHGEPGWHDGLISSKQMTRNRITLLQFYSYRLSIRAEFNPILNAGKLTQQYIVDAYCKIEGNNLNFIRMNQPQLRVDQYRGLMDHIHNNEKNLKAGRIVILPSSFHGSPRAQQQNYQDAMAIVRKFGKPDLFITMTCNPNWNEIKMNIDKWNTANFRPDIIARTFSLKFEELKKDLFERHVLGETIAYIYVIEFQKRGLPHAHLCITLKDEFKPRTTEIIDNIICAELPDKDEDPELFQLVENHMIHGPCGTKNSNCPCMLNQKCMKNFPKDFSTITKENVDGFPLYRRRKNDRFVVKKKEKMDNSWVVPYNKYLLKKFNCHINVEICASIKSIKYLFKYVYKGHDSAEIEINEAKDGIINHDEPGTFLDTRYVSSPEAMWRILEKKMHDISHSIIRLAVHLPNEQQVYFKSGYEKEALDRASTKDTTLTAWFNLNRMDPEARTLIYPDLPYKYVFHKDTTEWKPRKKNNPIISRMYTVSLNDPERYFLRLLLLNVKGPKSYDEIKTVNGKLCQTFKEAAIMLNLLESDLEWDKVMEEADSFQMPKQLRELYAYVLIFGNPKDPLKLFDKYIESMIQDIILKIKDLSEAKLVAMVDIDRVLRLHGKSYKDYNLPAPGNEIDMTFFDIVTEKATAIKLKSMLNDDQKLAYQAIMARINKPEKSNCFFVDGPGGSGKTFLYKALISSLRGKNEHVVTVASTGIAATLLPDGRTYHSTFKLPRNLNESSVSNMKTNSRDANILKVASLIIWDEATMATNHALNTVESLFRDIIGNNLPFGGKVIVLGGDFRQYLPVVKHGSPVVIIQSCIKYSKHWRHFKNIKLRKNQRTTESENEFADWLLKLGNGSIPCLKNPSNAIKIPRNFIIKSSIIDFVFGKKILEKDIEKLSSRAILSPKNDATYKINEQIIERIDGNPRVYKSIDTVLSENDADRLDYPTEVLNSLNIPGLPPHELILKKNAIIMLIRNLNTKEGLCNGTRLIIVEMKDNIIYARVLTNGKLGRTVFIPRINLTNEEDFPVTICRKQFPVILAFAMTINKSQGQTFERVGIFLPSPVFTHGQLYVAFSRATNSKSIKIKIEENDKQGYLIEGNSNDVYTINCVFREVFDNDIINSNSIATKSNYNFRDNDISDDDPCNDEETNVPVEIPSINPTLAVDRALELSIKSRTILSHLIQLNSFENMENLVNVWVQNKYKEITDQIKVYIQTRSSRIFTNENVLHGLYRDYIELSTFRDVIHHFIPIETTANGNCLYNAVSINIEGNENLSSALRLATVGAIIEHRVNITNNVIPHFNEALQNVNDQEYILQMVDLAFSACLDSSVFRRNTNEVTFPNHIIDAQLTAASKNQINYGSTFHQFILSLVTQRPLHSYGWFEQPVRAQRIVAEYGNFNSPPIHLIYLMGQFHYVGLIPVSHDVLITEKFTFYPRKFLRTNDYDDYINRDNIPSNEIVIENFGEIYV